VDFSAVLNGLYLRDLPTTKQPSTRCGYCSSKSYLAFREVEAEYNPETGSQLEASPRGDIYDRATLFWPLLKNEHSAYPPPGASKVHWPMLFSRGDLDD
jgi:hypothetical protein